MLVLSSNEAKKNEITSGVPAAITTAQAILETGYGRIVPVDIYNGSYSNNLFGIKAHGSQSFVSTYTHEYINGVKVKIIDKFIKYDSFEESIAGRTDFLSRIKGIIFYLIIQILVTGQEGFRKQNMRQILITPIN